MTTLHQAIESIALAPRDARQAISEKENKAIQLLRWVEHRAELDGRGDDARQVRAAIDLIVGVRG